MENTNAIEYITGADARAAIGASTETEGVAPALSQEAADWAIELARDAAAVLEPINDTDEVRTQLAIFFIELRSKWVALNTQMNYHLFATGSPDTKSMLRGSAVSALLARVENLVEQSDVDKINEFISEPIKSKAA